MFPEKYQQQLKNILDSTDNTIEIIYKELREIGESSRIDFLLEFKKFFDLKGVESHYKEELIDKRDKSEFEWDLSNKELKFAESMDHFTLELENVHDYYKLSEYPATDDWIKHKLKEINDFFKDEFSLALKKIENHRELIPETIFTNQGYCFPEELIDTSNPDIFEKIDITSYQIEIPSDLENFKNTLKEQIQEFENYFGKARTEAFLLNSFKFRKSELFPPQPLKLFQTEKSLLQNQVNLVKDIRDHVKIYYGIKKKEFAKTLFLTSENYRSRLLEDDFNEDNHLDNLTRIFTKNP